MSERWPTDQLIVSSPLAPEAFLAYLERYVTDWRDSRLPPELQGRVHGFGFHRDIGGRFRLTPEGMRTGSGWVLVECRGVVQPLPSSPEQSLITVQIAPARHLRRDAILATAIVLAVFAIVPASGGKLEAVLAAAGMAGLLVLLGGTWGITSQRDALWPGVQAMFRRVAREPAGAPVA